MTGVFQYNPLTGTSAGTSEAAGKILITLPTYSGHFQPASTALQCRRSLTTPRSKSVGTLLTLSTLSVNERQMGSPCRSIHWRTSPRLTLCCPQGWSKEKFRQIQKMNCGRSEPGDMLQWVDRSPTSQEIS